MVDNNIFNQKKMKEYIKKYEDKLVINQPKTNPVQDWINRLEKNSLEKEKQNYINFKDIILDRLLGYKLEDLEFEHDPGSEGRPVEFTLKQEEKEYVVVEAKGTKTKDLNKRYNREQSAIEQATNYASIKKETQWAIVTNYEEFRLFNPNFREQYISFNFKELEDEEILKEFLLTFSKFSLIQKDIPKKLLKETKNLEKVLEDEFYELFSETRLMLIKELEYSGIDKEEAIRYAQLILDRYIFICFAEDMELLPPETSTDTILTPIKHKNLFEFTIWDRINELFQFINKGNPTKKIAEFNGGLFKENLRKLEIRDFLEETDFYDECKKKWKFKEKYDEISELIKNYKDNLNPIYKNLLVISSFDFESEVDVNILGHIFENSIGDIEELKNQTKTKRKGDGVFYTPEYITDYICKNTIIPYLSKKGNINTIPELIEEYKDDIKLLDDKVKNIKIIDPACGSGAFLNKATDILLEIHKEIFENSDKEKIETWTETVSARRKILLDNIYGVDVNEESVEITKLGMFLKVAKKGLKLPSLDDNIKCGNSLINDSEVTSKAFDWKKEFKAIFDNGGFDIVIGNPPYISQQTNNKEDAKKEKKYLKDNFVSAYKSYDIYVLFVEQGTKILKEKGLLSYIIPNKFINAVYGEKIKSFMNTYYLRRLIDFEDYQIFDDAKNYTCIFILEKTLKDDKTLFTNHIENPSSYLSKIEGNYNNVLVNKEQMNEWIFLNEDEFNLLKKLEEYPKLIETVDNIWEGLRPGYEKAYIVYEEEILSENLEKELLKPFIKTEDITKYSINLKGLLNNPKKLIFPYDKNLNLLDINKYPNIKNHLTKFTDDLYDSNSKNNDILRYEYYHLPSDVLNHDLIITPDIANKNSFAKIENELYFPNTIYAITLKEEYLIYLDEILGILNSNLTEWYIKKISPMIRGGYYRYKSTYLEQIPIINLRELPDEFKEIIIEICNIKTKSNLLKNSFIKYLERLIEVDLNSLSRKTYLTEYWKYPFYGSNESLLNILKHNKNKIKININSLEFQESLEREFDKNIASLSENDTKKLENKLNKILYKAYNLNEKEINIIEKSLQ